MIISTLHLFQSYRYNALLFLKAYIRNPKIIFSRSERQSLDWTLKVISILVGTILLMIGGVIFLYTAGYSARYELVIGILLIVVFFPFYLVIIHTIFLPFQWIYEGYIIHKAKHTLRKYNRVKVICIVGSYGKTSQKEILHKILSSTYTVLTTLENRNTLLSVAYRIIHDLKEDHDIFVVEMGEDHTGDIKKLCKLVHPHIGIITGITKQHLDTFGSYDQVIQTIGELFGYMHRGGKIFLHKNFGDLRSYMENYKEKVYILPEIQDYAYLPNFQGISFKYKEVGCITKLITPHSIYPFITAWEIAESMGIETQKIIESISQVDPITHRMQPIYNAQSDIRVIDDTYNGNIEGFKSGRDFMTQLTTVGKKRYITPGLIGLGAESKQIHFQLGEELSGAVDKIILIKNENTVSFEQGLREGGTDQEDILLFTSSLEAHQALGTLLSSGDVILFQNDIPDLLMGS